MSSDSQIDLRNCFKILVATDIHLGYNEKDEIRGEDSFKSFQEILHHAESQQVDFILLGGDLFHDTNPSKESLQRCLHLLHKYTLGDKPIDFQILSSHEVNYQNPNMNIGIPVFSIHGNHDDPSGFGGLSSIDLLSTTNLLNYFGRCDDLSEVKIDPILMKKGTTQLALYGLSHIHDNRLSRLFRDSKVIINKPDEESGDWFNIMVLHQNRVDRGPKNYVPEEILPECMDLIVWGHEHDCRILPEEVTGRGYYITQPGSSVATSLSEGESIDKHIAILYVQGHEFKMEPIKLQTVRPFIFKSIDLMDYEEELDLDEGDVIPKVKELIMSIVEEMLQEAERKYSGSSTSKNMKPLIRLRVHYKEEYQARFNAIRLGQQYNDRVANPIDMIKMERHVKRIKAVKKPIDEEAMRNAFQMETDEVEDVRLEDYVDRYFNDPNNSDALQVMFSKSLSELCRRLAEYKDDDAADKIVEVSKQKACKHLEEKMPENDAIEEELQEFRLKEKEVVDDILKVLSSRRTNVNLAGPFSMNNDNSLNEKENNTSVGAKSRAAKATKTTAGPAARGGRGRSNTRSAGPSTRNELNVTSSRKTQQPTIAQALTKKSTRQTDRIQYLSDDD